MRRSMHTDRASWQLTFSGSSLSHKPSHNPQGELGEVKMLLIILTGAVLVVISTGIHLAALSGISETGLLLIAWTASLIFLFMQRHWTQDKA